MIKGLHPTNAQISNHNGNLEGNVEAASETDVLIVFTSMLITLTTVFDVEDYIQFKMGTTL